MLKVRLDRRSDAAPVLVERHSVKLIKDAQIRLDKKKSRLSRVSNKIHKIPLEISQNCVTM